MSVETITSNPTQRKPSGAPPFEVPPEIQRLLDKYRGHRVPPLNELISERLLENILHGFTDRWGIPLAIYCPQGDPAALASWTKDQRFIFSPSRSGDTCNVNESLRREWKACKRRPECDLDDLHYACETARREQPLVYMCHRGLIYLTHPVVLDNRVVGVLFTGQFAPSNDGVGWRQVDVEGRGGSDEASDLRSESCVRIRATSLGTLEADPVNYLGGFREVGPSNLDWYKERLRELEEMLLEIARKTVELEKDEQRNWFRGRLFQAPRNRARFWEWVREWLTAWQFPDNFYFLGLTCPTKPDHLTVSLTIGLPGVEPKLYEIGDQKTWERLRGSMSCDEPGATYRLARLLKGRELPSAPAIALPLGKHGLLLYGVAGTQAAPAMTNSDHVSAGQFGRDMGLILDHIEKAEAKEEFLACFSHELRSPIASACFTMQRIRLGRYQDPAKFDEKCRRLLAQLDRHLKLVDGMLCLQKILAGERFDSRPVRTSLLDFIQQCASQAVDLSDRADVGIIIDRATLAPLPAVEIDTPSFALVVFNLLDNAIKYSTENTEIRIHGRREGPEVVLTFTNIGIRVPQTQELDVFEKFARTVEARCIAPHSSGIGLFLVKHIMRSHQGHATAESTSVGNRGHLVKLELRLPVRQ